MARPLLCLSLAGCRPQEKTMITLRKNQVQMGTSANQAFNKKALSGEEKQMNDPNDWYSSHGQGD
jgi:hypothetical protein